MIPRQATQLAKNLLRNIASPLRNASISRRLREHGLHPPTHRSAFLRGVPVGGSRVLEIGPFDSPQLQGAGVSYFDVLDRDGLRSRARELGRNADGVPPIHYVSPTGDLEVVDERFEAVLSCHAIEHQPDLIRHLQGVGELLRPGGRYFLVVPDKRFSFDHYLSESTLPDVLAAHAQKRRVHTQESVLAHYLQTTHNSCFRHWLGLHGHAAPAAASSDHAREAARRAAAGEYVDVHAWILSPAGFRAILASLVQQGLIPFDQVEVHETEVLDAEFFAVLTRR
jgi:SAM-dependent methyltransferase